MGVVKYQVSISKCQEIYGNFQEILEPEDSGSWEKDHGKEGEKEVVLRKQGGKTSLSN